MKRLYAIRTASNNSTYKRATVILLFTVTDQSRRMVIRALAHKYVSTALQTSTFAKEDALSLRDFFVIRIKRFTIKYI